MTKSLKQIQKENRKFILSALGTVEDSPLNDLFYNKPLTLSRVLLAFSGKIFKNKISLQFPDFLHVNGFNWNLTKETLEEQTEETQRGINKILTRE